MLGRVLPSQKKKEKKKLGRIVKFKFLFKCLIRKNTVKIYKASTSLVSVFWVPQINYE